MFKKIFCAAITAAIIFVGNAKVSAQDIWVYTDRDSGTEYYVIKETVTFHKPPPEPPLIEASVKSVRNGKLLSTKKYSFNLRGTSGRYYIDGSYAGTVVKNDDNGHFIGRAEPANSIFRYCYGCFGEGLDRYM